MRKSQEIMKMPTSGRWRAQMRCVVACAFFAALWPLPACVADNATAAPSQTADADTAEAWLARIEARAAELKTLTATLRYDRINTLTGDEQRRFGKLWYDAGPPGRFAIHLDKLLVPAGDIWRGEPQNRWYIFDGQWLLERNHDDRVAIRRQLVTPDELAAGRDPLGLGEGPFPLPLRAKKDAVLARYTVTLVAPAADDPAGTVHLKLVPHDAAAEVQQLDLWYDRTTLLPVKAVQVAEDEAVITLRDVETDTDLPPATFDTALPAESGWTVEQGEG